MIHAYDGNFEVLQIFQVSTAVEISEILCHWLTDVYCPKGQNFRLAHVLTTVRQKETRWPYVYKFILPFWVFTSSEFVFYI